MSRRHRSRAQGYVEFGLGLAVVALIAVVGLDQLRGAVYTYFTGEAMSNSLNPPPPPPAGAGPVTDHTKTTLTCQPSQIMTLPGYDLPVIDSNEFVKCTINVLDTDDSTKHPGVSPPVSATLGTSATSGTNGDGAFYKTSGSTASVETSCALSAIPGGGSTCDVYYMATASGAFEGTSPNSPFLYLLKRHQLDATFSPPAGAAWYGSGTSLTFRVKRVAQVELVFGTAFGPRVRCNPDLGFDPNLDVDGLLNATLDCDPEVNDHDNTPLAPRQEPTGTITWNISPLSSVAGGSFPRQSCTFDPVTGRCPSQLQYTPTQPGDHRFVMSFHATDYYHSDFGLRTGPFRLNVWDQTTTWIESCSPFPGTVGAPSTCVVKIKNNSENVKPQGTVTPMPPPPSGGSFTGACTFLAPPPLDPAPDTSECHIQYVPAMSTGAGPPQRLKVQFAGLNNWWFTDSDTGTGGYYDLAVT